ncbi:MAG: hypothetical protein ND895_12790 [Pyrinomonadaceae bacterium]|nr:hypothetical protein [Pyrinomonadaceae bacterium]
MMGSNRSLSAAVLLTLFLASSNLVMAQSSLTDEDRIGIVRAVLKAELARQVGAFENIWDLSTDTDNTTLLISPRVIADLKLTPLSLTEITEKAYSFTGARYLRFKRFNFEDNHAIVTLSVIKEVETCILTPQKQLQNFTYNVTKVDGHWQAELTSNPRPSFTFDTEKLTFGKSL